MTDSALLMVIAVGSTVIVGVAATGYFLFSRFLKKENERGKRFDELNRLPPDERS